MATDRYMGVINHVQGVIENATAIKDRPTVQRCLNTGPAPRMLAQARVNAVL